MASPKDLEAIREELRVLKEGSEAEKITAALGLANLANSSANRRAIEAEGAVGPLVQLVKAKGTENKKAAAQALQALAKDQDVAQAIADQGGRCAQEALKWKLPEAVGEVQGHVNGVKSGSAEEQFFAAEQLGTWAAMSDEKRGEINKAGGCEALVALVVNGSDDAKWHAARALRNLANHAEAKESILKADGIAILTPLAKHGKGKVKEAAGEALNLLSVVDAKAKPAAKPDAASIPSGAGTRVAMFSARFDGGPIEKKFRQVFKILREHHYDVLMVAADAGESFGDLTTQYLGRLKREEGTMLAVCTKNYGEMTDSAYSAHKELKFALDYEKFVKVLPLKVEETYPPEPPGGTQHKHDKDFLAQSYILSVFKPCVVYLDCQDKSETEIAAGIAKHLLKHKAKG